ncbi:MAG: hypothetical protein GY757_59840, partial [bacterium]|nr:hypothetical protein [bacterium]
SLASGQEEEAAHQGALLVEHYQEYLDHDKSRRLGEWILAAKKKDCTTAADAALLKALAETLRDRDKPTSIAYYQQAHSIYRTLYGPEHPETKNTQEDLDQLKN